jgi:hypothetical protein
MSENKYLDKLAKLLNQAERAATPEEAEAFMQAAQRLSTATAIDLEVARQHVAQKERRETPSMREIPIGERGTRLLFTYVQLFLSVAAANDVKCDIAQNSTKVYAYGFASDIDVTQALYSSLLVQMVRASDEYLNSGSYKSETTSRDLYERDAWGYRRWVGTEQKPVHRTVARKSFQLSFASQVGQRLRTARREAIAAAEAERVQLLTEAALDTETTTSTGTELVLAAKEVEVRDFYKSTSNAKGSYRGGKSSRAHSSHASRAGTEAGAKARLGGEKALGGSRKALA